MYGMKETVVFAKLSWFSPGFFLPMKYHHSQHVTLRQLSVTASHSVFPFPNSSLTASYDA
jgi:hypothetical protein